MRVPCGRHRGKQKIPWETEDTVGNRGHCGKQKTPWETEVTVGNRRYRRKQRALWATTDETAAFGSYTHTYIVDWVRDCHFKKNPVLIFYM